MSPAVLPPPASDDPSQTEKAKAAEMAVDKFLKDIEQMRTHKRSFWSRLRSYFFTGLVVAAPLGVTLLLVTWFVQFIDGLVTPVIPDRYNPQNYLPFGLPGLGILIAMAGLTLLGALTANFFGRSLVRVIDSVIDRMPVVRSIYAAIKQIFETILSHKKSFQQVGLIEYPRRGLYTLVFISREIDHRLPMLGDEELTCVFVATTPNPTSGFLLFLPRKEVIILDMSIEDCAKAIISAGIIAPPLVPLANGGEPENLPSAGL
jgi:uncharacterized membrane protein